MSDGGAIQGRLWEQPASRWVAHVDMDAFFASVEQRDNPLLGELAVIVCNSPFSMERLRELIEQARTQPHGEYIKGLRGVVASASYEARIFGVRSAMPLARALVLCPNAVVLPGRFGRYGEVAGRLREVWGEFSPVIEPVSLDEAYLDLTGSELSGGSVRSVGERLKARIQEATGLTASVGIASNKLLAKIASDLDKPDGLVVVPRGDEGRTLAPLSVRALPGVGPRTAEALGTLEIATIGQLACAPFDALSRLFGSDHAASLLNKASGIDSVPVQAPGDPKSVSREITLAEDSCDLDYLRARLRGLSDQVAWTLRSDGYMARCVYIKLRLLPAKRVWSPDGSGFGRLLTRQATLSVATSDGAEIYSAATRLLEKAAAETGLEQGKQLVRLLGVGTASLFNAISLSAQPGPATPSEAKDYSLDTESMAQDAVSQGREKQQRLNGSLDTIRERYGFDSIVIGATAKYNSRGDFEDSNG